jgi:phosphoribosylformylglycinamidine cyclo-ligase
MAQKLTYKKAGVDVDKGERFVEAIRKSIKTTRRPGVVGSVGGFAGFFRTATKGMKDPLLVSATDGVGTKLLIAKAQKRHDTIGIDLVAMCVNDLICCGAEPLFFLDYLVTGGLDLKASTQVIKGIAKGCKTARCAIVGGETAEHPGCMRRGEYDLAGFSVGIVDRKKIVDGKNVKPGDVVLGLCSNGPHSNGFSLIRKVFSKNALRGKWGRKLLMPTLIYVKPVLALIRKGYVKSIAHITGGGLEGNVPRVIPSSLSVIIDCQAWKAPAVFREIQKRGSISQREMFRTFNMGIGMTLVMNPRNVKRAQRILTGYKVKSAIIGVVIKGKKGVVFS